MKNFFEEKAKDLIAFEKSPILNGAKSKLSKAALALTLTVGTTAVATGIAPVEFNVAGQTISNIEPAQAWGNWWEHPFYRLGSYRYSQHEGNNRCLQKLGQLRGATSETNIGFTRGNWGYSRTFRQVIAWDGWNITHARHVWYHRRDGLCIANKSW